MCESAEQSETETFKQNGETTQMSFFAFFFILLLFFCFCFLSLNDPFLLLDELILLSRSSLLFCALDKTGLHSCILLLPVETGAFQDGSLNQDTMLPCG